MKKNLHPENYRFVVFKDLSNEYAFLTRSAADTKDTIVWEDGNEYPLVKLEISHTSHPSTPEKLSWLILPVALIDSAAVMVKKLMKLKDNHYFLINPLIIMNRNPSVTEGFLYFR